MRHQPLLHRGDEHLLLFTVKIGNYVAYKFGNLHHFLFSEASRGDGGGSDTKSACHEGRKGLVGNCVFVCRNVNLVKTGLKLLAGQTAVGKVEEHQVIVGSARHNADTAGHKLAAKHLGVFGDVFLIFLKFGRERLSECHRLGGDYVHKRSALNAGENGLVYGLGILLLAEDHAASRAAQSFVGRGGDNVGKGYWRGMKPRGHKTRNVGDVDHHIGSHLVAYLANSLKINGAGIGAGAGHYHFGLALKRDFFHFVIVDLLGDGVDAVGHNIEIFARNVNGGAVGKMSALGKVHAHYRVAGIQQRKENRKICVGAAVRLNIGVFGTEKLLGAVSGVDKLKKVSTENPDQVTEIYNSVSDYLVTSVDFTSMIEQLMNYSFSEDQMYTVPGKTVEGEPIDGKRYEEYHVDEDAMEELIMKVFYTPVQ